MLRCKAARRLRVATCRTSYRFGLRCGRSIAAVIWGGRPYAALSYGGCAGTLSPKIARVIVEREFWAQVTAALAHVADTCAALTERRAACTHARTHARMRGEGVQIESARQSRPALRRAAPRCAAATSNRRQPSGDRSVARRCNGSGASFVATSCVLSLQHRCVVAAADGRTRSAAHAVRAVHAPFTTASPLRRRVQSPLHCTCPLLPRGA